MPLTDEDVLEWKLIVYKIAHVYWRRMSMRPELEDFIGEGFVGLIRGLIEYDDARSPNKKAYLCARVSWAITAAIRRDEPVTRRGYERGARVVTHHIADLEEDIFATRARDLDQRLAVLDLEALFGVMLEEERNEFLEYLERDHDPRSKFSARTFARPKSGVSKVMVSGFTRMQGALEAGTVLRLHRTLS